MSSLLASPFAYDPNLVEGVVTNVDPKRFVCSVRTNKGQYLNQVIWLVPTGGAGKAGMHFAPNIRDQVLVHTGLTYPTILGCLPKLGVPSTDLNNVTGVETSVDVGNNTDIRGGYELNPEKPNDFVPGDMVMTTEGGAAVGALANGSAVVRASTFAQIFMTKFDDLVRIVARNFERFSDLSQQTVANVKGRLYEYMGWDRDLSRARNGLYELQELTGDVAAGEVLLGEPNDATTLPSADTRVFKRWLTNLAGQDLMVEVLKTDGSIDIQIKNAAGTQYSRHIADNASQYDTVVTSGTVYSEYLRAGNSVDETVVSGSNISRRKQDATQYLASMTDGSVLAKMVLTPTAATLDFNSVSKCTLTSSSATLDYNGNSTCTLNSSSATLAYSGGGNFSCNSSGVHGSFSGHFFDITSSGVNIG